jgi:hypothetical protein
MRLPVDPRFGRIDKAGLLKKGELPRREAPINFYATSASEILGDFT